MDISELALGKAMTTQQVESRLDGLRVRLRDIGLYHLGLPGSWEGDFRDLADLLTLMPLNNLGDPFSDSAVPNHTKDFEREVLQLFAHLFRAPDGDWWGYISSGSSEAILHALRTARRAFPEAMVYHSSASHHSVVKAIDLLGMPRFEVAVNDEGEMVYSDLQRAVGMHRGRPAIVMANTGTTMTEAIDDVRVIASICDTAGVARYIHADAALSGIPLACAEPHLRPGFDLSDGADSISCSGHKMLPAMPSAVFLSRRAYLAESAMPIDYLRCLDMTISGSRNGHVPLQLWHVLAYLGVEGLGFKVARALSNARYLTSQLADIGWYAYRQHSHAVTVVLKAPPPSILDKYSMPVSGGISHVVCVPGVGRQLLDELVADLAATAVTPQPQQALPPEPMPTKEGRHLKVVG